MKKMVSILLMAAISCVRAQEAKTADAAEPADAQPAVQREAKTEKASWPVWLAFNSTKHIDVVGLRLTLPYGACESVTGFDLGFYGRCRYMEGFQVSLLHNEAEDVLSGFQVSLYNTAGRADMLGLQAGLWNEALSISGLQAGLVNIAGAARGFQVGLVNRCESLYGIQIGLVNVIREGEWPFMPLINIGFESFGTPAF